MAVVVYTLIYLKNRSQFPWEIKLLLFIEIDLTTVSAQIRGRRLIKKLRFYGEISLNKMLSN